jgi:hypothetical protein
MKCAYCQSELDDEAHVCKVCKRDLYLFKPLQEKITALEEELSTKPSVEAYESTIAQLEQRLEAALAKPEIEKSSLKSNARSVGIYILVPLLILLLAHELIVVVYDAKLLYLRLISIAVPLPFGYFLFATRRRSVVAWFTGVLLLALVSVIGMSWLTSLVDRTPVLPQNMFEWREFIEYAASISFSFLTGMLLGSAVYRRSTTLPLPTAAAALIANIKDKKMAPDGLRGLMNTLNEYGRSAIALGTTGLSIYTGLKAYL